jgi:hypothetical protein
MLLLSLVAILALSGCAEEMTHEDWAAVSQSGANRVYAKMRDHDVLNLADIENLSQHHVPSNVIIHYLRSTGAVYYVNDKQSRRLRHNGVETDVIDYLHSTAVNYRNYPSASYPYAYYPYSPYYPYVYDPVNDPMYGSIYVNGPFYSGHFHHSHHGGLHGGGHHHH